MSRPKLLFAIIDNGMGLSRTRWGSSMFKLGVSGVLDGFDVNVTEISYPYPAGACNFASHEFMKSDCDRMIIIDTDESFSPVHVRHLLSHSVPFVSGLYAKKEIGLNFPIELLDDGGEEGTSPFAPDPNAEGVEPLVEVARCARGFLNVDRGVFELVKPHRPSYEFAETGEEMVEYWRGLPGGGSEDYEFCDLYRKLGGRVFVDQRIIVDHWGSVKFPIAGTF